MAVGAQLIEYEVADCGTRVGERGRGGGGCVDR